MAISALRIPILAILLLTGCDKAPVPESVAAPIQQIESPLQNTIEGMAKAKALDQERARTAQPF